MWPFNFLKSKKDAENNCNIEEKLADRYSVRCYASDGNIPFLTPRREFRIVDRVTHDEFNLEIRYDESDVSDDKSWKGDRGSQYCSGTIHVEHFRQSNHQKYSCSFSSTLYQKDFPLCVGFKDVDLDLYNQLKQARQDSSNPKRQEDAYLVCTLLRAAHDNIWIAPLLKHQRERECAEKLKQIEKNVFALEEQSKDEVQARRKKLLRSRAVRKQQRSIRKQQENFNYAKYIMTENLINDF